MHKLQAFFHLFFIKDYNKRKGFLTFGYDLLETLIKANSING